MAHDTKDNNDPQVPGAFPVGDHVNNDVANDEIGTVLTSTTPYLADPAYVALVVLSMLLTIGILGVLDKWTLFFNMLEDLLGEYNEVAVDEAETAEDETDKIGTNDDNIDEPILSPLARARADRRFGPPLVACVRIPLPEPKSKSKSKSKAKVESDEDKDKGPPMSLFSRYLRNRVPQF